MATRKPMAPAAAAKVAADPAQEGDEAQAAMPAVLGAAGGLTASEQAYGQAGAQGEMSQLRMQMQMDRKSKANTTISNVMQKTADTADNVTDNIK